MSKIIKGSEGESPFFVELAEAGRVLPREVLIATERGREIIDQAKIAAAQIREKANQILQEAIAEREQEKRNGFEEGHQEGLSQLTQALASFEVERERSLQRHESEIIEMVLEIAKKVVARELKNGAVQDVVAQALQRAVGDRLVLRVHPEDRRKLDEKRLGIDPSKGQILKIEEDETLTPGGCLVQSELGSVDARVETQWKAIEKVLGIEK